VVIDSSDTLNKTKFLGSGCECSRSLLFCHNCHKRRKVEKYCCTGMSFGALVLNRKAIDSTMILLKIIIIIIIIAIITMLKPR
jgi:hypothetical protein